MNAERSIVIDTSERTPGPPEELRHESAAEVVLTTFIEKLGPEGVDAIRNLRLAERDLRIASTAEARLSPTLERADRLAEVRRAIEDLLFQSRPETSPHPSATLSAALGNAAITERRR